MNALFILATVPVILTQQLFQFDFDKVRSHILKIQHAKN